MRTHMHKHEEINPACFTIIITACGRRISTKAAQTGDAYKVTCLHCQRTKYFAYVKRHPQYQLYA